MKKYLPILTLSLWFLYSNGYLFVKNPDILKIMIYEFVWVWTIVVGLILIPYIILAYKRST